MVARKRSDGDIGSSKRPEPSSSSSSGSASLSAASASAVALAEPITTLENFALLPNEIRSKVVDLACSPPFPSSLAAAANEDAASDCHTVNDQPSPRLDYTTALNLTRTSQTFYCLVAPILFRSVFISTPSALGSFCLALHNRPQLAGLVKNLYVGPEDELPRDWNPLVEEEGFECSECSDVLDCHHAPPILITSSLRSEEESRLLPQGCSPSRPWPLDRAGRGARSSAVFAALQAAQKSIDIDLLGFSISSSGVDFGRVEWLTRLWEAQAVLDIYLIALRRWEDVQGIVNEDSPPHPGKDYPLLRLSGWASSLGSGLDDRPSTSPEQVAVSRTQVLQHLARRQAITDRFDHPLPFLRSGISIIRALHTGFQARRDREATQSRAPAAGACAVDLFSSSQRSRDYLLPKTASVASLLSLLRSVLVQMLNLRNLTLAGFLELAICGSHPAPLRLASIKSLSIGPPAHYDLGCVRLSHLAGVEELRICSLRQHNEIEITSVIDELPQLHQLQVIMANQSTTRSLPRLVCALRVEMQSTYC